MPNFSAILTNLVFIVTKSAIQCSQFTKLIALVIVLTLRSGSCLEKMSMRNERSEATNCAYRLDDLIDHLDTG